MNTFKFFLHIKRYDWFASTMDSTIQWVNYYTLANSKGSNGTWFSPVCTKGRHPFPFVRRNYAIWTSFITGNMAMWEKLVLYSWRSQAGVVIYNDASISTISIWLWRFLPGTSLASLTHASRFSRSLAPYRTHIDDSLHNWIGHSIILFKLWGGSRVNI